MPFRMRFADSPITDGAIEVTSRQALGFIFKVNETAIDCFNISIP